MGLTEDYSERGPDTRSGQAIAYLQENYRTYALIAPVALFLLAVVGYPILQTFRLSLYEAPASSSIKTFVGLQNYAQIFTSDIFYQLLWQTGRWIVVAVALKTILGLLIALHLKGNIKGRKFFRTAFLIPWGIPYAISAVVFRWIEHPQYGYLNSILLKLGLIHERIGILGSPDIAWLGVVVADVWIGMPFMAIIFLAGLQSIPEQLYEAAAVDGAEKWSQFRYITLPQLKDVLFIATLLSTIWTFVSFDVIWTMTGGGPVNTTATLVIWIYKTAFDQGNLGLGAAYSVIGFFILAVFAIIYLRVYTSGGEEL
ncbi:carbohydrate ABC transporter permease [Halarchaeum nitratireducens]|uniref:ABC transporter permease n=1 Tax=Halarchaeum nitratireducens TaxID=489913 RepID=A0A830GDX0_9EURY|nr:sugar ABC transporter permease [Halarchaeum nitratireducens]GGN24569.1 ABC transporter permease [Halarchaeum nitratireducens]